MAEEDFCAKLDGASLRFKLFHVRRINDAIWGMASPSNDHAKDGTSDYGHIFTGKASKNLRVNEIITSLRNIELLTSEEERAVLDALEKMRYPPVTCPCCGKPK